MAYEAPFLGWHTKLSVAGDFATGGEGWRYDETWHKFIVSLETGASEGGAYDDLEA